MDLNAFLKDRKDEDENTNFIGHIHMVSRCYCKCSEMLVLLVLTMQQYLTIPQQLPNTHKSKLRNGIRIYTLPFKSCHLEMSLFLKVPVRDLYSRSVYRL
jgi:hypothetical protein